MTRITIKLTALAALAAATPAAAQWGAGAVDTQSLRTEIDAGVSRGDISPDDAASLRSQLRGLMNLERQYAQDGMNRNERYDLQQRALGLRNEIGQAEGGAEGDGRADNGYRDGGRYGTYDNGRYGAYGDDSGGYGTPNSGTYGNGRYGTYGNSTYSNGRYGTYDNGNYGNGRNAPYGNGNYGDSGYGNGQYSRDARDEAARDDDYRNDGRYDRGDANGRDDSYGDDEGGDTLRVGDRAAGGLAAVPNAYRGRFRDGGNVYYRYGDGNVYQIDTRTGIVMRIYPIDR
jgi:hypothetical protein